MNPLQKQCLRKAFFASQSRLISVQVRRHQEEQGKKAQSSKLISDTFGLGSIWKERIQELGKQGLAGDYEWITMVQKKYSGGGFASAIDLDVATTLSTENDQIKDLLDLVYRLRHTSFAGDLLPSTEYAMFRLLMKYGNWDVIFTMLNDPINYGLFMNEHLSCLAMANLLRSGNIPGAAKIATVVMQQEMFDFTFLNFMAIYSLLKWNELPPEERTFDQKIHAKFVQEEINEDEMKTIKFPYLKNAWNDGHFDLEDENALVGKSIEWFSLNLPTELPVQHKQMSYTSLCDSLVSLGRALQEQSKRAAEEKDQEEEDGEDSDTATDAPEENQEIQTKSESKSEEVIPTAEMVYEAFQPVLSGEEQKLVDFQKQQFVEWSKTRMKLIEAQAERLDRRLRLDEISGTEKSLRDELKLLFFFENRSKFEETAAEKEELYKGQKATKKQLDKTEKEYMASVFEIQRKKAEETYLTTVKK